MAVLGTMFRPSLMRPALLAQNILASRGVAAAGYTGSVDATSGKPVPANASEWSNFITTNGLTLATPDYLHLCQEASGNLADTIGGLTLTANGTPAYQQSITGWTRKAVRGNGTTAAQRFLNGSGPNPSTTSVAQFFYLQTAGFDATVRYISCIGTVDNLSVIGIVSGVSTLRVRQSANIATGTGDYANRVTPCLLVYNQTTGQSALYTDLEKIKPGATGTPASNTGYSLGPASGGTWASSGVLYFAGWTGAGATAFTDATAKTFLQALGYTVPWS